MVGGTVATTFRRWRTNGSTHPSERVGRVFLYSSNVRLNETNENRMYVLVEKSPFPSKRVKTETFTL